MYVQAHGHRPCRLPAIHQSLWDGATCALGSSGSSSRLAASRLSWCHCRPPRPRTSSRLLPPPGALSRSSTYLNTPCSSILASGAPCALTWLSPALPYWHAAATALPHAQGLGRLRTGHRAPCCAAAPGPSHAPSQAMISLFASECAPGTVKPPALTLSDPAGRPAQTHA